MAAKRTRRQHVVSAFSLRGFANAAGQLRCAPRDCEDEFTVSVGDASIHSDFYSIVSQDGTKDDALESWLAEVEDGAAPVLRSVLAGEAPPSVGDDRLALSGWIAAQYLRGVAARTMLSQAHEMIGAVTSQQPNDVVVEAIQSAIDTATSGAQADRKVHVWLIRELMPLLAAWLWQARGTLRRSLMSPS